MNFLELAEQVRSGDADALKAYIQLKKAEEDLKQAFTVIQPLAIDQADKYEGKTFQAFGAQIEKKSAAGKWDYSHISAWKDAKEKVTYVEKIAQAGGGVDLKTGEQIDRAIKIEGKSTIAVKLLQQLPAEND